MRSQRKKKVKNLMLCIAADSDVRECFTVTLCGKNGNSYGQDWKMSKIKYGDA
jgi:hypothetical protein